MWRDYNRIVPKKCLFDVLSVIIPQVYNCNKLSILITMTIIVIEYIKCLTIKKKKKNQHVWFEYFYKN